MFVALLTPIDIAEVGQGDVDSFKGNGWRTRETRFVPLRNIGDDATALRIPVVPDAEFVAGGVGGRRQQENQKGSI
jgi:hypothetical protein